MLVVNQNYFIPLTKYDNSLIKSMGTYGSTLKGLYILNKFLQVSIDNKIISI